MTHRPLALILFAALLAVPPVVHAANDDDDLPATLRRGYVDPIVGPQDSESYARGHLGILRDGYGRASLYVAWRTMQVPLGALAKESHERRGNAFLETRDEPYSTHTPIHDWIAARDAIATTRLDQVPDFFRSSHHKVEAPGLPAFEATTVEGNCGADAFTFAVRTLRELVADTSLTDADRRAWIAGQDAVFARCAWLPGTQPVPALPAALPAKAPARLKALRAYQHAAALFYSDDFEHARQEFDAIAATPGQPMRAWAALGAMRSVLRPAGLDKEWMAAFTDAYTRRGLRDAALNEALAPMSAKRRASSDAAMADITARYKAIAADPALAEVVPAARYTARRAVQQLAPAQLVVAMMNWLDHPEYNPYAGRTLDLWMDYFPRAVPVHPDAGTLAFLRKHAFYDWTLAMQACKADAAPDDAGCRDEHAHAQARWEETKHDDWLLATLTTARQPDAALQSALDAARAVPRDHPAWASLQFQAARILQSQGRKDEARKALAALAGAPELERRDDALVKTALAR